MMLLDSSTSAPLNFLLKVEVGLPVKDRLPTEEEEEEVEVILSNEDG